MVMSRLMATKSQFSTATTPNPAPTFHCVDSGRKTHEASSSTAGQIPQLLTALGKRVGDDQSSKRKVE
jgi:hypothetical protein